MPKRLLQGPLKLGSLKYKAIKSAFSGGSLKNADKGNTGFKPLSVEGSQYKRNENYFAVIPLSSNTSDLRGRAVYSAVTGAPTINTVAGYAGLRAVGTDSFKFSPTIDWSQAPEFEIEFRAYVTIGTAATVLLRPAGNVNGPRITINTDGSIKLEQLLPDGSIAYTNTCAAGVALNNTWQTFQIRTGVTAVPPSTFALIVDGVAIGVFAGNAWTSATTASIGAPSLQFSANGTDGTVYIRDLYIRYNSQVSAYTTSKQPGYPELPTLDDGSVLIPFDTDLYPITDSFPQTDQPATYVLVHSPLERNGGSLKLSSGASYAAFSNGHNALMDGSEDWSAEVWIRGDMAGVEYGTVLFGFGYFTITPSGSVATIVYDSLYTGWSGGTIAGALLPTTWTHIAAERIDSKVNTYINGVLTDTFTPPADHVPMSGAAAGISFGGPTATTPAAVIYYSDAVFRKYPVRKGKNFTPPQSIRYLKGSVANLFGDLTVGSGVGPKPLAAAPAAVATVSAALTNTIPLAAPVAAVATATAALSSVANVSLAATVAAVATVNATISTANNVAAGASATATVTAALTNTIPLAATAQAIATASGFLPTLVPTSIDFFGSASVQATLFSGAGDPHWANVSTLLHLDGTSGTATFTESGPITHTYTDLSATGIVINSTGPKFGTANLALVSASSQYISTEALSGSEFDFGAGDFTVSMQLIPSTSTSTSTPLMYGNSNGISTNADIGWYFAVNSNAASFVAVVGTTAFQTTALAMNFSVYNELTATRYKDTLYMFVNGVMAGTGTAITGSINGPGITPKRLAVGRSWSGVAPGYVNGRIDEVRITKGVARYTSNFTPAPLAFPSTPAPNDLVAVAKAVASLSNTFLVSERLASNAVANATVTANLVRSGAGGGQVLDATPTAVATLSPGILVQKTIFSNSFAVAASTAALSVGVRLASAQAAIATATAALYVPSIASDPSYANVALLLHGNNDQRNDTFIDYGHGHRQLVTTAGVSISTAQSKFGAASLLFNGSSGKISVPKTADFSFGTGDFTIEAFIYVTTGGVVQYIYQSPGFTNEGFALYLTGANVPVFQSNCGAIAHGSAISLNAWHHIAAIKSGANIAIGVDGAYTSATATNSNVIDSTSDTTYIYVGSASSGNPFAGYIDEARITKSVARYTAAYTVPTAAFLDYDPSAIDLGTAPGAALATVSAALFVPTGTVLDGDLNAIATLTAGLIVQNAFAAAPVAVSSVTANLSTLYIFAGSPAAVASSTSAVSLGKPLALPAASVATVTAALAQLVPLASSAVAQTTATGAVGQTVTLAASAAVVASSVAAINQVVSIAAASIAVANVSAATMLLNVRLAAVPVAVATVTPLLTAGTSSIAAAPTAQASVTAALSTSYTLAISQVATATASANLFIAHALQTAAIAQASTSAVMSLGKLMAAVALAQASVTGVIASKFIPEPLRTYLVAVDHVVYVVDADARQFVAAALSTVVVVDVDGRTFTVVFDNRKPLVSEDPRVEALTASPVLVFL